MPWRELANDYSIVNALREKAPDGYGLGASNGRPIPPTVEGGLNTATQNGWYYFGGAGGIQNIPSLIPSSDYGYLLVSSRNEQEKLQVFMSEVNNYIAVRKLEAGVWQPWEYVNPPMDLGVEYRTTERYLGYPVYIKLINLGSLPNAGSTKQISVRDLSIRVPISMDLTWGNFASENFVVNDYAPYVASAGFDNANINIVGGPSSDTEHYEVYAFLKYSKSD